MTSISSVSNNPYQQMHQLFQTVGTDLQSGNLSGAQSSFSQFQQLQQSYGPGSSSAVGGGQPSAVVPLSSGATSIQSEMSALGSDLQNGNLSAAQSAYSSIQSSFQSHHGGHMRMMGGMGSSLSSSSSSTSGSSGSSGIGSLMSTLASDLQSGNLSGAQSTYSAIQSDFQQGQQSMMNGVGPIDGGNGVGPMGVNFLGSNFSTSGSSSTSGSNNTTMQSVLQNLLNTIQNNGGTTPIISTNA